MYDYRQGDEADCTYVVLSGRLRYNLVLLALQGLSHQNRLAWKYYGSIDLGKDRCRWTFNFFYTLT
jgi:hypothetical protein